MTLRTRVRTATGRIGTRTWLYIAAAVVLVGGGVGGFVLTDSSAQSASGVQLSTRLVAASTGTVRESVSTTGTLTPADKDDVSFTSTAQVTSVNVAVGDKVAKGQVLGTIDTVDLVSTLASARANLASAQSTLTTAEDDSSTTAADLAADRASVTDDTSKVNDAETALEGATLRSPIAGTVAEVNVTKGSQSGSGSASSSSSSGSGQTGGSGSGSGSGSGQNSGAASSSSSSSSSSSADFVVVGLKSWTVTASVDDTEIGLVARNDQAEITTDGATGTIFGTVASVSVLSSTSSGSASYPVTVAVTGSPTGLHDGASATVSIIYRQASNVLTVPTAAVHVSGTTHYVELDRNGAKAKQTVTTGLASGGTTQITSGLQSGQQVYVQTITRTGGAGTGSTRTGSTTRGGTGYFGRTGGGGGYFPGGGAGNTPGGGANVPGGGGGN